MYWCVFFACVTLHFKGKTHQKELWQADFVGQEYEENTELAKVVETVMINLGMRIMQELLAVSVLLEDFNFNFDFIFLSWRWSTLTQGIGGRLPRSFGSQLIDVLYKLVSRYVEASRQWLQVLLAQVSFEALSSVNIYVNIWLWIPSSYYAFGLHSTQCRRIFHHLMSTKHRKRRLQRESWGNGETFLRITDINNRLVLLTLLTTAFVFPVPDLRKDSER